MNTYDIIDQLPYELAAVLASDSFFCDIPIIVADEGNVAAAFAKIQAAVTTKNKKRGVAVIVLQMVGDDEYSNLATGPLLLRPGFQVVENRELNLDSNGTGKSARRVARRIRDVIKGAQIYGLIEGMTAEKNCIQPVTLPKEMPAALVAYQASFQCYERTTDAQPYQVAMPSFGQANGAFTLTSATAGAAIWYTTDDTFPAPPTAVPGSTALLYSGPVPVPVAVTVRAMALLTSDSSALPSAVTRAVITP